MQSNVQFPAVFSSFTPFWIRKPVPILPIQFSNNLSAYREKYDLGTCNGGTVFPNKNFGPSSLQTELQDMRDEEIFRRNSNFPKNPNIPPIDSENIINDKHFYKQQHLHNETAYNGSNNFLNDNTLAAANYNPLKNNNNPDMAINSVFNHSNNNIDNSQLYNIDVTSDDSGHHQPHDPHHAVRSHQLQPQHIPHSHLGIDVEEDDGENSTFQSQKKTTGAPSNGEENNRRISSKCSSEEDIDSNSNDDIEKPQNSPQNSVFTNLNLRANLSCIEEKCNDLILQISNKQINISSKDHKGHYDPAQEQNSGTNYSNITTNNTCTNLDKLNYISDKFNSDSTTIDTKLLSYDFPNRKIKYNNAKCFSIDNLIGQNFSDR